MANAPYTDTVDVLRLLERLGPRRVLDVGAGFGRWGFLCRCHLGSGTSLTTQPGQSLVIDAIEAFAPNVNPVYSAVYNAVHIGDAREMIAGVGDYDVILCSHMIEHIPKADGWALIDAMKAKASMAVVLGVPFHSPLRGAVGGNPYEAHVCVWSRRDFAGQRLWIREYPMTAGETSALVVVARNPDARWIVRHMRFPWLRVLGRVKQRFCGRRGRAWGPD